MSDEAFRVMELSLQGFECSQILARMDLDAQGRSNPELVRAMSGLLAGLGCGRVCGCLTGGCCVLGLHAGRGDEEDQEDERLGDMLAELVEWFERRYGSRYGGTSCDAITRKDAALRLSRCPEIVIETFQKTRQILADNGYAPDRGRIAGAGEEGEV